MPEYKSIMGEMFLVLNGKVTTHKKDGLDDDKIQKLQAEAYAEAHKPPVAFVSAMDAPTGSEQNPLPEMPKVKIGKGKKAV